MKRTEAVAKRLIDLMGALTMLIVLSPFFIILSLIIKLTSAGPIIFQQERVGKHGRPFIIYKFRTMVVGAEKIGAGYGMVPDDPRLTPPGRLLRRLSLDELPELFNVFKGEMSLVGPRPTLKYQVQQYDQEQMRRLRVRPGITGLAQVRGRNDLPWSARIKLDNWYIDHYSLLLDLKIVLATIYVVITGKGVRQDQSLEEVEDFKITSRGGGAVNGLELMLKTKIVMFTTVHGPFDVRIFHKEASSLVANGFKVSLIAPHEREEIVNGVKIIPLPSAANRLNRLFQGIKVFLLALQEKGELYHFHDPELIWVGLLLKLATRSAVVYDAHEYYGESILSKEWIPQKLRPLVGKLADFLEKRAVRFLDGVVTATKGMEERFKKRTPRTVSLNNYPLEDCFCPPRDLADSKIKTVIYVGNINKPRGLEIMIQTIGLVSKLRSDCCCLLVGKIDFSGLDPDLRKLFFSLKSQGFFKVRGQVDYRDLFKLLHSSQLGWNPLLPAPHYRLAVPTKLYEYLAAGLPVIAGDFGSTADLIRRFDCGYLVNPFRPEQHAEAIVRLIDDYWLANGIAWRGYRLAQTSFHWDSELEKLSLFYRDILAKNVQNKLL